MVENLTQGFEEDLYSDFNAIFEVGERVAIIGENGVGKTTLLNTLAGALEARSGEYKWSENSNIGYYAQDHAEDFAEDLKVFDWMAQWRQEGDDEQVVRSFLGRMLFGQDDIKKSVKVLSGGEQGRMLLGKIMMHKPNILLMDEPTNHMDMESIESLNNALEQYKGTLFFVSHDRVFVDSLATRILEIKDNKITDFRGTYAELLKSRGIDG
ncbi:ABC transporter ATP-binding protein uup [Vibrio ishigakensis]|uniref:ABC transporter ATP-binding protein uup n=1 Tax=Vibrio ishigakensis TaxID=1481914 RepID=A0A0B8QF29_9VIBR|nr:ABC transporter ATP-binding protein uup [Vibrio ishigakensis]